MWISRCKHLLTTRCPCCVLNLARVIEDMGLEWVVERLNEAGLSASLVDVVSECPDFVGFAHHLVGNLPPTEKRHLLSSQNSYTLSPTFKSFPVVAFASAELSPRLPQFQAPGAWR